MHAPRLLAIMTYGASLLFIVFASDIRLTISTPLDIILFKLGKPNFSLCLVIY